jgi:predicted acyl esterase
MKPLDPAARPSRPDLDVHLTENVMVLMRDGIRMATDTYRPARAGRPLADRRPVLLHRTPYNKLATEATSGACRVFAFRGYVVETRTERLLRL